MPLKNLNPEAGADDDDLGNLYNPLVSQADNDRQQIRKNLNMAGSFGWEIFKNFRAKTEFGHDNYSNYDKTSPATEAIQYKDTYTRTNRVLGIGCELSL
jgi:hypothetical protein